MYKLTIEVDWYELIHRKMKAHQYECEMEGSSEEEANAKVKDYYASEFGTDPEEIRVTKVEKVDEGR
ncbi:hypothetical protein [Cytobacillus oceanisediminis]|uniref:hypothetical protein n=1 Tax=Cytobacillus oceanisediminis TaxID=665099 RepID=UPI001FB22BBA|nr:hypothetical protein [Cytobacillus oceanisediminis]UOE58001.1 hypothetical protein IRB79_27430 [Cytobacillus oceanisediminis]